ncbi:STAS domain-containing protein [Nostoc sp. UHCC 0702]|nr:STAS domain-containing protein [Nostoc sp. UHCC 0702]
MPNAQCPIPNSQCPITQQIVDKKHKNHLYLSVHFNDEEGIIAEPLNLTVSLRGTREVRDNCQLFRLTGLLDAFSEPTFRKVLEGKVDEGPKHIILDLSKIDFVDSSGLGALVQLAKKAQNGGGTLQIVSNARVTQTVKLVRLEKFLALQPSVEVALENINQA